MISDAVENAVLGTHRRPDTASAPGAAAWQKAEIEANEDLARSEELASMVAEMAPLRTQATQAQSVADGLRSQLTMSTRLLKERTAHHEQLMTRVHELETSLQQERANASASHKEHQKAIKDMELGFVGVVNELKHRLSEQAAAASDDQREAQVARKRLASQRLQNVILKCAYRATLEEQAVSTLQLEQAQHAVATAELARDAAAETAHQATVTGENAVRATSVLEARLGGLEGNCRGLQEKMLGQQEQLAGLTQNKVDLSAEVMKLEQILSLSEAKGADTQATL